MTLFADYHQLHVFDDGSLTDLGDAWTDQAVLDGLAVAGDALAVGTEVNVSVTVTVEVLPGRPSADETVFDHVVEGSVEVRSGRLVVMGCTDFEPDAARFTVPGGWMRVRVARANLAEARRLDIDSDEDPATMERVQLQVWPEAPSDLAVLKRWQH
ncbi:competence protein ComJ [Longispora fulva]|uniref:competence protein ComJ n=1 Tax=Longispora fulva TaxID=619741 RepID=UPI001E397C82|nr:competence protein ComJ [Longispora fulva]